MVDTFRVIIDDLAFYNAVLSWRQDDLGGVVPARINADALRSLMTAGKVIDMGEYKEKQVRELLADLNEYGLNIVVKDMFQLRDQGSWCRDITMVLDEYNHSVIVEASLPKFFMGQNVDLLLDYKARTLDFLCYLFLFFRLPVPSVDRLRSFQVGRVDICYFYKFPSQIHAFDFISSFKMWSKHKRKKVHHYDTSMMFVGSTWSLKFYQKYDEFKRHDRKEIKKKIALLSERQYGIMNPKELYDHCLNPVKPVPVTDNNYLQSVDSFLRHKSDKGLLKLISDYDYMLNFCESMTLGMVRAEFTLRRKKLNYDNIYTVGDFLDLDICEYYEKMLDKMGVLTMGHTKKDEYFDRLKTNKKLLQYCALLETFGVEKVKELYCRETISRYNSILCDAGIAMDDFKVLKEVNLSIRDDDRAMIQAHADGYIRLQKTINGSLF